MRITRSASSNNAEEVVVQEDDNNDAAPAAEEVVVQANDDDSALTTFDEVVASESSIFPGSSGIAKAIKLGDVQSTVFLDLTCQATKLFSDESYPNQQRRRWIMDTCREKLGKGTRLRFYRKASKKEAKDKGIEVVELSEEDVLAGDGPLINYIESHMSKSPINGVKRIDRSLKKLNGLADKNPAVHRRVQVILGREVVATPPNPPNKSEEGGSVHDDEEDVHRTDDEEDNGMDNSEDEVNNNNIIINDMSGSDDRLDAVGGLASDATPNSPPNSEGKDLVNNPKSPDGVDLDNVPAGIDNEDDGPPFLPNIPPRSPTKNIVKKENKETVKVEEKQKQDGRPSLDPVIWLVSVFGRYDSSHSVHNLSYLSTLIP